MILYHRDDCPFCWKVRLLLSFADIAYETIRVERGTKHPDVLKLSQTGTVPIMVDDGLVLTESAVQAEYINEKYAKGAFLSPDPAKNAAIRQLHQYSDTVFGKVIYPYISEMRDRPQAERRADILQQSVEGFASALQFLSSHAENILTGPKKPNLADCALYPRFALARQYGLDFTSAAGLAAWFDDMAAHPAVQAAEEAG